MSNKYSKDKTLQSMKAKKDEHISGIAGAIFAIFMVACVLGAIIMSENNTSDITIGIYVTVTMLIGIYILFALKVASQWEKVVVLRLADLRSWPGRDHSGSSRLWTPLPHGSTTASWSRPFLLKKH